MTSISDITRATGLSKGAIYGNFKDKDEVATAAFELATQKIALEIQKCIRPLRNAPQRLQAIVEFYEGYITHPVISGGCPIMNCAVEADDNYPKLRLRVVRFIEQIRSDLIQIIQRGMMEGQIKKDTDAELQANLIFAAIEGAIVISRVEGDSRSFSFVKRTLLQLIESIRTPDADL